MMLTYDSPFLMAIICCRNFSITDFEHIFILILIKHCKINAVTTITYLVRYIFLLGVEFIGLCTSGNFVGSYLLQALYRGILS